MLKTTEKLDRIALSGMKFYVYLMPEEINTRLANIKLEALGVKIDTLTEEQRKYLNLE